MKRLSRVEMLVGPERAHPENWPNVDTESLSHEHLERFRKRVRAVKSYLLSSRTIKEITAQTGISKTEIRRLVQRCYSSDGNGHIWGWAALLPHVRIKEYRVKKPTGKAGRWQHFLDEQPEIEKQLKSWALAKKPADGMVSRGQMFQEVWIAFERVCAEAGVDTERDYPFCNKDRGREAVRLYCHKIRTENFVAGAIARHNKSGVRPGIAKDDYWDDVNIAEPPYHRVQLDGHRIDADFVVVLEDADGKEHELPLSRLWLLVMIDTTSRAVIGYHISLEENYTADDVLTCVANALEPWVPRELPNERISYARGAGLPNGVIDECAWRAFSMLHMDNAWAQTSQWVQERIIETIRCEVVTNRPRSPRSNAIVERFMRTFERSSLHKWPTTTGSNPEDPRRKNPEKQAKKLRAQFDDLLIAADLAIANYNAAPHGGLNGMAPLDFLRQRIERNYDFVRKVRVKTPGKLPLFQKSFTATVRGSQKLMHTPYVQFMRVRYSSSLLSQSPELIGKSVTFRVNVRDIRTAEIFHKGRSLGVVHAEARWMRHRHSLRTRRVIMKLAKRKLIDWASENPVGAHIEFIHKRRSLSRRERNKLLRAQREAGVDAKSLRERRQDPAARRWPISDQIRIDSTFVTR